MLTRYGRLTFISIGVGAGAGSLGAIDKPTPMITAVAAAASTPVSFIAIIVFCRTSVTYRFPSGGCAHKPVKSAWSISNACVMPKAASALRSENVFEVKDALGNDKSSRAPVLGTCNGAELALNVAS